MRLALIQHVSNTTSHTSNSTRHDQQYCCMMLAYRMQSQRSKDQFTCNDCTGAHACRGVSYNYGLAMLYIIPSQHGTHHPYIHVERPTCCRPSLYKAQHYSATVPATKKVNAMASILSLIISCALFFSCEGQGKSVYGGLRSCSCSTRVYS